MKQPDSDQSSHIQLKQVLYSSGFITIIFLLIKTLGFLEKVVLARFFGTGDDADAYIFALTVPTAIFIVFEEILGPVLIPFWVENLKEGRIQFVLKIFKRFLAYCLIILTLLAVIGTWQSAWVVSHLAPGFAGVKLELTIELCKYLFITVVFLGLSSLITVIFHAYKKFNLPIWAHALHKLTIIVGIIVFHSKYGIYSAVIGFVLGSILRILLIFWRLPISLKTDKEINSQVSDQKEMKRLLILMLPLLCGVLFSQASALIDNLVASKLASGSISALSYARKIVDLPILIVPFAMGIVLLPYLSSLFAKENQSAFVDLFEKSFKILFISFLFLTIIFLTFHLPMVKLLFQRGKFDDLSSQLTGIALSWFSIGLVAFAVEIPIMQAFFALKDTFTPIWVGIGCVILNIFITLTFVDWLGFIVVPIALSIQKMAKIVILLFLLSKKIPIKVFKLVKFAIKPLLAGFLIFVLLRYLQKNLISFANLATFQLILYLVIGGLISLMLFLGLMLLLKVKEMTDIFQLGKIFIKKIVTDHRGTKITR